MKTMCPSVRPSVCLCFPCLSSFGGEPGRTGSPHVTSDLLYRPAPHTGSERRAGSYRFAFSRLLAPGGKRGPARLLRLLYCHATRIGPLWVTMIVDTGSGGRTGTTRLSSQSQCTARAGTTGMKRLKARLGRFLNQGLRYVVVTRGT